MKIINEYLISQKSRLESELILAHILNRSRAFVLAHGDLELTKKQSTEADKLMARLRQGEPLAYLLGEQKFYGLKFKVNKNVLIPRPETELMIDHAPQGTKNIYIDIGTGSGCVIITLAKILDKNLNNKFYGVDISSAALNIAKQNAKLQGVSKKIKFLRGKLLTPLLTDKHFVIRNSSFVILANLPYVPSPDLRRLNTPLTRGLNFEPRLALDGGPDGFKYYRQLAGQIKLLKKRYPETKITLLAEIGRGQVGLARKTFGQKIKIEKDLAKIPRIVIAEY